MPGSAASCSFVAELMSTSSVAGLGAVLGACAAAVAGLGAWAAAAWLAGADVAVKATRRTETANSVISDFFMCLLQSGPLGRGLRAQHASNPSAPEGGGQTVGIDQDSYRRWPTAVARICSDPEP